MQNRIKFVQDLLAQKKLDTFLVTNPINIFYLTGFRGISATERESYLLIDRKLATLIAPRLYENEAKKVASANLKIEIVFERDEFKSVIQKLLTNCKNIGFEKGDLKYSEYLLFRKLLQSTKLKAQDDLIENLRLIKTPDEIAKIEKAQIISQNAFESLIKTLKIGQTEAEIAEKLGKIIKNLGADSIAFESIVAAGPNSSRPHYTTGNTKIKKGNVLLFDFGAKYKNYCADLSRTIFIGKATNKMRNTYNHVQNAQNAAIQSINHGSKTHHAYHAANDHFKNLNLHDYFTHGLGHGIGLEVHEKPHLRPSNEDELKENMVFSIEPGLYMPWSGVRIEDLFAIKNGMAKLLGQKANFVEII